MKKRFLAVLLAVLMVISLLPTALAVGDLPTNGGDGEGETSAAAFDYDFNEEEKTLTISGAGPMPEASAFEGGKFPWNTSAIKKNAEKIIVPDGITTIAANAFAGFEAAAELSLPSDLTAISENAFQNCKSLTSLSLNGVTISNNAFQNCSGLTSITLEKCEVAAGAFRSAFFSEPATLEFTECNILGNIQGTANNNLVEKIILKDCSVSDMAFTGPFIARSAHLKYLEVTGGTLGKRVFIGNSNLESVTLSDVTVGSQCFSNCSSLKKLSIEGASSVASRAFDGCNGVEALTVSDETQLGYSAIFLSQKDDGSFRFPALADRVEKILKDKFSYAAVPEDTELTVPDGWESAKIGENNGVSVDTNQITKAARWVDQGKRTAEVQLQFSHVGRPGTDFVFLLDYSNSMTSLGNENDGNSRFYDMQSKVADVSTKLLTTAGYNNRVAIVSFGGKFADDDTTISTTVHTMTFTNDASTASAYIMADDPYNENTDYSTGLEAAEALIRERDDASRTPVIIFISDGKPNMRTADQAAIAKRIREEEKIDIFGVMQSVPVKEEEKCMASMQEICTDGLFFKASDTTSFSDAVNAAVGASYGYFTITDAINTENFSFVEGSIVASDSTTATYDADTGVITWNLNGIMPYQTYTLTFRIKINTVNNRYPGGTFDTNSEASANVFRSGATESCNTVASPSLTREAEKDKSNSSTRPTLNTEDHFAYVIGYPVDYVTGEPTTDQTRRPVRPQGEITRAEVATIFFRMLSDESRTRYWSQENSYSDVQQGQWFNAAISTLSNAGIIDGYPDGTFRPDSSITRAEFATIAVRFFDVQYKGKHLFSDIQGHWAQNYIDLAGSIGLVNGYPDGTFGPDRFITRAEAVTLVNRALDRHPDQEYFLDDMLVWPDNMDTTAWYYADMQEATNSHEYEMKTGTDNTRYEVWTKILPIRNWSAFEKEWSNAASASNPGEVVSK